jgi:hypothetical protein
MRAPRAAAVFALAALIGAASRAGAQPPGAAPAADRELHLRIGDEGAGPAVRANAAASDEAEHSPPAPTDGAGAGRAASKGAFLPYTVAPSTDVTYAAMGSGYNGARRAAIYEVAADAHVVGGLSVRAGYSSHDLWGHSSAMVGGRYQILRRERHWLDLSAGLFYLPQDINGEGLVMGSLLLGRNIGRLELFGSLSYGQDPEGDDHDAQVTVAGLYPLLPAVLVGIDARARGLVFSSDSKHQGLSEPVLDVAAGPLAHYVLGPFTLTGHLGMSGLAIEGPRGSVHDKKEMRYGVIGLLEAGLSL